MRGYLTVIYRDLKRLWVDRIRVAFGLIQPLLYLFVLGSGLGASTAMGSGDYLKYIFPGVVGLTLLFTATFAAISIVFDREWGFLKAMLVAPISRRAIALGKITSGAIQAIAQAIILLILSPLVGVHVTPLAILGFLLFMVVSSLLFSTLGVSVAARFTSMEVFPVVSNAVLMPMFFLSGAMFPLAVSPYWLRIAAHVDPVAYAVDLMRGAVLGQYFFPLALSLAVLAGVIIALTWMSVRVFERGEEV